MREIEKSRERERKREREKINLTLPIFGFFKCSTTRKGDRRPTWVQLRTAVTETNSHRRRRRRRCRRYRRCGCRCRRCRRFQTLNLKPSYQIFFALTHRTTDLRSLLTNVEPYFRRSIRL